MLPVEVLREETRHLHLRLESLLGEEPLTTLQGYRRFLSMHGSVQPPVEGWLARQEAFHRLSNAGDRLRTSALQEDFDALRLPVPVVQPRIRSQFSDRARAQAARRVVRLCVRLRRRGQFPDDLAGTKMIGKPYERMAIAGLFS